MMFKKQKATRFVRPALASSRSPASKKESSGKKNASKKTAGKKAADKSRPKTRAARAKASSVKTRQIAVWDIDVHSGFVNRVLDAINQQQQLFKFTRIEATVPIGLTMSGHRTREIVQKFGGDANDPAIERSVWAEDIYSAGRPILKSVQSDLLVCLLAPLIANRVTEPRAVGRNGIALDFFSVSSNRIVLVSAFGLRNYAMKVGRPFEASLAALIVAEVFVECFGLKEHDDTRGCIMDYCDNRDDIVHLLQKLEICADSLKELPAHARNDALQIVKTIREYKP
ncbi:hypothetical protein Q3C01_28210 [Bradyrhizobium sp. UFLA05-109]